MQRSFIFRRREIGCSKCLPTFVTTLFVSPACTVIGAVIGSMGALSLTSFSVTTNDNGAEAATPVFSLATT